MFLALYLPTLILAFCGGMLIPVLPLYASSFEISYGLVGLVLAGEALGTLLADLPAGSLLRRLDRKWAMLVGLALIGASVLGLVVAQTVWQLLLLRLLAGIGGALWNLARHAYLVEMTRRTDRGRAIAMFGGTNRIGAFVGPAVGGVLAGALGLRAPFVLFAVLTLAAMLLAWRFVPPLTVRNAANSGPRPSIRKLLRQHRQILVRAGLGQLLAQMIRGGRALIIPLYGASVLGLGVEAVGFIISVAALLDMSLFLPAGLIMDRFGRKFAIVPSFLIQGLGMALVPLAGGFATLLIAASVIGLGNGLGSGTMMTLGADLAPDDAVGEFLGVWRLIGDGGSSGGPLLVGVVADLLALPAAAAVIAGVGLAAAAVFAFGVPETLRKA